MKKILFTLTPVLLTAGAIAEAGEVKLSGYGRFGIGYLEDRSEDPNVDDTILVSRFRLNLDGVAETDGGVEFSTRLRLQADESITTGEAGAGGLNGARFSVIYEGLRVDVGNVGGAIENMPNRSGNQPGLESFVDQRSGDNYEILGYTSTGTGENAVFVKYAFADFAVGASYDTNTTDNGNVALGGADQWDISIQYSFQNFTAALAYGETDGPEDGLDPSLLIFTLGADFGDFSGTLLLARDDDTEVNSLGEETDGTAYGASLAYDLGAATTILASYGDGTAEGDTQEFGVGAIYDLGAGVTLRGGVGSIKEGSADRQVRADFGVRFNF